MKRLGLVINPVAGIGGRVGLKGSDGRAIVARARALGAVEEAQQRAELALQALRPIAADIEFVTYGGRMGEDVVRSCGWVPTVVGRPAGDTTTAGDTRAAAQAMADTPVDLLLFAGGDGTARDIFNAIGVRIPVLGIPAGVKIHSAAFAISPRAAGELAVLVLSDRTVAFRDAEVMDIDEDAFRDGRVSAALYGVVRVPADVQRTQSMKAGRAESEEGAQAQIAFRLVDEMQAGDLWIIGPGTTTHSLKRQLGISGTLLGVDVVRDGRLIAADATERRLLEILQSEPATRAWIAVTIIGGQGYIFGRGNQQISPAVIRLVGMDHIRVIATREKLSTLAGRPLLVDTGDPSLDAELESYRRVVVGSNDEVIARVSSSLA